MLRTGFKKWALAAALLSFTTSTAAWAGTCTSATSQMLVPSDADLLTCQQLAPKVADPSALPLDQYEAVLNEFFSKWCHRNKAAGWERDMSVRDTGPYTAALQQGANGQWRWEGSYHGTHSPVVIWYSPKMVTWLNTYRPVEGEAAADAPPPPDGAIMVKEMYQTPAAACASEVPETLKPSSGAAIMIRDSQASKDGWFWGWYGWGKASGWKPDWPATQAGSMANMGFGQYCVNCHASAKDMTFADSQNLENSGATPLVYLSQYFANQQYLGGGGQTAGKTNTGLTDQARADAGSQDQHVERSDRSDDQTPLVAMPGLVSDNMRQVLATAGLSLPPQTYDNVWVPADGPNANSMFVTSDQCAGCHDAGSTGLQFDMTMPNPHVDPNDKDVSGKLLNLSPYATWRTSPMGLAGRDPIFYAQMSSETQSFHPEQANLVQTTCFGCHGIQGQRQYQIDHYLKNDKSDKPASEQSLTELMTACGNYDTSFVHAIPFNADAAELEKAKYGALSRDGISCMSCHRMVLGDQAKAHENDAHNACAIGRQKLLNSDNTGFAKTFTGSFLLGAPDNIYGPFKDNIRTQPMEKSLGITPTHNSTITSSEMCGSCHTVHLPIIYEGQLLKQTVYEQTTYPEWAFSAFRTGDTPFGPLPGGWGEDPKSCQDCHMPSEDAGGKFRSKIASIQEYSNFPQSEHTLGKDALDLPVRKGFALHSLVGLNLFVVEMAQQYPEVFGIPTQDPMLTDKGMAPLVYTENAIVDQAQNRTAILTLPKVTIDADKGLLTADVDIESLTGHKFPSGVGFRRAFVTFEVMDQAGDVIWSSGQVNDAGVLLGSDGNPLPGELWWDASCTSNETAQQRLHQPHYQVVTSQDQVQIYQELVTAPPPGLKDLPNCDPTKKPDGPLTTSFLSICGHVKDNRLPPKGFLSYPDRLAIAKKLGAGEQLAEESGYHDMEDDQDYAGPTAKGGDRFTYQAKLSEMGGKAPHSVRATLSYQATPPFYLQDRFCTAKGDDRDRLAYLTGGLNLKGTPAENWALTVSSASKPIAQ